jgi:hypothetical protein
MAARNRRRGTKSSSTHGDKATFVRGHANVGAQQLVKLARQQGMSLTAGYIYNIRAADKSRAGQRGEKQGSAAHRTNGSGSTEGRSSDEQLRNLVLRIGLDRAEQIFEDLKAKVQSVA